MITRRELMAQTLALPLLLASEESSGCRIISEESHVSQESAAGFRQVTERFTTELKRRVLVFTGVSGSAEPVWTATQLFMQQGGCVIWEQAPLDFTSAATAPRNLYVRYSRPAPTLVRAFGVPNSVICASAEVIARFEERPVARYRRIGKGGWLHLASMLGPHIRWGDDDALVLARSLLTRFPFA